MENLINVKKHSSFTGAYSVSGGLLNSNQIHSMSKNKGIIKI